MQNTNMYIVYEYVHFHYLRGVLGYGGDLISRRSQASVMLATTRHRMALRVDNVQ